MWASVHAKVCDGAIPAVTFQVPQFCIKAGNSRADLGAHTLLLYLWDCDTEQQLEFDES